ncbi:MAG TPA: hypothetical protein DD381_01060 [Lentisphaeria bacterium]|nr:MAG: hypothetical protein A2X47_05920 [Lentisphaerae bacterium GWF2_38_69]HBM14932.1 hypothetical protein [Lentisphaeria bacterium]
MFINKHYVIIAISILLSYSLIAANNFGLTSQQRILIEAESYLRHSGYSTFTTRYGNYVKAKKDHSEITLKLVSLSSDSDEDQGVACYITTFDEKAFVDLSKDLESFASLNNIQINILSPQ